MYFVKRANELMLVYNIVLDVEPKDAPIAPGYVAHWICVVVSNAGPAHELLIGP